MEKKKYVWGEDPINDYLRLYAKLYYYLADGMLQNFGEEGERVLRESLRKFGESRGKLLKKRHEEAGLELNVENLFTHYDLPGGKDHDGIRKKIQLDADNRVSETYVCYMMDQWEEDEGYENACRVGSIYCEEFHWSMWAAYDPDIKTELPQILSHKCPCCHFEVHRKKKDSGEEEK